MSQAIAEHRRATLYSHISSRERRAAEKAPRTPVAELQSRHVNERRELGQERRIAGEKLHRQQEAGRYREHSIGPPHRAPEMETRHARELQQQHRQFDEKETAMAKRHRAELEQAIAKHGGAP
jgi:hypothetical protein